MRSLNAENNIMSQTEVPSPKI